MAALKRLAREVEKFPKDDNAGITAFPVDGNLLLWNASIEGPKDSPYEGYLFSINITIPSSYPIRPPNVNFITSILHPNINQQGAVCLDILKDNWSPSITLYKLLISIQSLLNDPNFDDPLVPELTTLHSQDCKGYEEKVKYWCKRFARKI